MDPHGELFRRLGIATVRASTPLQPTDTVQTVDAAPLRAARISIRTPAVAATGRGAAGVGC